MFSPRRLIGSSLVVFVLGGAVLAQESRAPIYTSPEPVPTVPTAPLVTATATAKRVRFVSPGSVVQLRLEVFNEAGQKLFDTELHGGNVLDWHLQDGAGERLPTGSYATVLTIKSLSGRLSQRVGVVTVNEKKAAIAAQGDDRFLQLSMAQQQIIGPVEGNGAFTILQPSESEAITAVTHNGTDGHLTSTAGALTFRTGNVFAGKDKEHMRITEEGRVGIGTDQPGATLDVAGSVRVSEGVKFSDGTTLKADKGKLLVTNASGEAEPANVSGTGTLNRLAKWNETGGEGTLTDAAITEVSGLTVFGVNSSGINAPLFPTAANHHVVEIGAPGTKTPLVLAGGASSMEFWKDLGGGTGSPAAAGAFGVAKPGTAATNDMIFSTYSSGQPWFERMRITNGGDVGVGVTNPGHRLDVAGNINTSTQYNIGGGRALVVMGTGSSPNSNTFAGIGAGLANIDGFGNSYFGKDAGKSDNSGRNSFFGYSAGMNSTSPDNSFFGYRSGFGNETGSNNSFFGSEAGESNTTGSSNSFFGESAGTSNKFGSNNAYFGSIAGFWNLAGSQNSFFGALAGFNTGENLSDPLTAPSSNSFFGYAAGAENRGASNNSYFGSEAGEGNSSGANNSFFGALAGLENNGDQNTFVGYRAGDAENGNDKNTFLGAWSDGFTNAGAISNATAVGHSAFVTQSNSLVLGSISGVNGGSASTNVGIGTTAPTARLHVVGNSLLAGNLTVNGTLSATAISLSSIPPGSDHYIHNNPASQQSGASFNVSGSGTVGGALTSGGLTVDLGTLHVDAANNRVGVGTTTPESPLHVAGTARAGILRASINAGSAAAVTVGERYRDNSLIGWGKILGTGVVNPNESFGITVVRDAAGVYTITLLSTPTNQSVPVAVAEVNAPPTSAASARLVTIDQIDLTHFKVYITNGSFAAVDNDFTFLVTGR
jgi:hypothetical protein